MIKSTLIIFYIAILSTTMNGQIERIISQHLPPSKAPLSTAIKANGFLFISGQLGYDKEGKLADSFEGETENILTNLGLILQENKLEYQDVVSITIYIKDMNNFSKLNEIYRPFFDGFFPTRTCIAVADLPMKANVEMTVTAALK